MDKNFTREYWQSQMIEFHKLMGNKKAMSDFEKMQRCVEALTYVYMTADGITKSDGELMNATLLEFTRRQELWIRYCEREQQMEASE